jgi:hypothetical protein
VPNLSIRSIHDAFDQSLSRAANLLANSKAVRAPSGAPMHVRDIEEIAALSLLRLSLSWESYVEETFLRYICGAASMQSVRPALNLPRCASLSAAFTTLLAGRGRYLNWTVNDTTTRANQWFVAGGPYLNPISAASSALGEMQTVRNRMAHRSDFSKANFTSVVRTHFGYVPRGITPGRFLLMVTPTSGTVTVIEHYSLVLAATAQLISNHR